MEKGIRLDLFYLLKVYFVRLQLVSQLNYAFKQVFLHKLLIQTGKDVFSKFFIITLERQGLKMVNVSAFEKIPYCRSHHSDQNRKSL